MSDDDTIAALASAPGQAGIGVVRVSGPAVPHLIRSISGRELPPRRACLTSFRDAAGNTIDQGIALFFPAPGSYTGEDILELQGHGGPVVLRMLLKRCLGLGARLAEPGEFTRRAFLNDKLDLAQAEAVADLIAASTEQAVRSALRSLQGEFSRLVNQQQATLTELRVLVEATLDFPEEDLEFLHRDQIALDIEKLLAGLTATLSSARQGSLLRDGIRVALIGPPNVGKSSIINSLSKEDVAIVSAIPGTTRDWVRQSVAIRGLPIHIIDTAGLRHTEDPVEVLGVARTWEAVSQADLVLLVSDLAVDADAYIDEIANKLPASMRRIRVHNKLDLVAKQPHRKGQSNDTEVWLSAKTGAGMDLLEDAIAELAGWQSASESTFIARERHIRALEKCKGHLEGALARLSQPELVAEELRQTQLSMSLLTGEVAADDLLGEIFSRFCIGK